MNKPLNGLITKSQQISLSPEHEYSLNGVRFKGVTNSLRDSGINYYQPYDDFYLQRGKAVHLATELYDKGTLDWDTVNPICKPFLFQWIDFQEQHNVEIWKDFIELKVYREDLMLAGMIDRLAVINGRLSILDIKTGSLQPWTAIQTAGYEILLDEPVDRYAVNLPGDRGNSKNFKLIQYKDRKDKGVFLASLTVGNWLKNH